MYFRIDTNGGSLMKKIVLSIVIGIIALLGVGILFAWNYYKEGISAVSDKNKEVIFVVESGQTGAEVLTNLEQAGLVKNAFCGKIYMKINKVGDFKANSYILNENMSLEKIFNIA